MTELLATLPTAIAVRIKLLLPALRQCEGTSGRYNVDRLLKETITAPAVLVSVLQLRQSRATAGPLHLYEADFAAFIITKSKLGLNRDEAGANIATALAQFIPDRNWGISSCGEAKLVRAQSVVTASSEASKASLWAVTWTQPIALDLITTAEQVPVSLYVGQSPDIGVDHEDDYLQIGGVS